MSKGDYRYVFSWFIKQPKSIEDFHIFGAANLDALIGLAARVPKNAKYKAYTKAEADKLGLVPAVTCLGPVSKRK